jgi:dTDP-4-amino-4,6-dideoxygalactose transaminase
MTPNRKIPFGKPWITDQDRRAVLEVLEGTILTHGPQCRGFEEEFASFMGDGAHCVTVSSCMAALHLAYFHMGIGPGDEVIVPAQTHTATAHAVELVGARPVFADCDPNTGNVDPAALETLITPRTKALSVVHFLGIPCDMDAILTLAERHDLRVVEDCALAVGTRYVGKHVGLFGDAGCFSFYPVKHITAGEGGMFVTRHKDTAEAVSKLRGFGVDRTHLERAMPGMYDVVSLGLNYRMSELQAALGRQQLRNIKQNLAKRNSNFSRLKSALGTQDHVRIIDATNGKETNSHYCLTVVLEEALAKNRDDLITALNQQGVGTSIYYPQPVPRMSYYQEKYGYDETQFPHATDISDHSIALPVGPHISEQDVDYIADRFKKTVKELNHG